MDAQIFEDVRRGQLDIVASQARMEGQVEGIKLAVEAINATLSGVADVRADIATLKERDRHSDPLLALLNGEMVALKKEIDLMHRTATQKWIEGLVRNAVVGLTSGGLVALAQHLL